MARKANIKPWVAEIVEAYRSAFKEHGVSPSSLLIPKGKQALRFEILTSPWNLTGKKVLDIGCGFADLYQFLEDKGTGVDYTGIELLPEFAKIARSRFPAAKILEGEILEVLSGYEKGEFDVAIASGTFNVLPPSMQMQEFRDYVFECITRMVQVSRQGVSVDFQSTYNIDFKYPAGFYLSPVEALDFCLRFGRASLRHDYMPYEYAIFIYKDSKIIRPLNVFKGWEKLAAKQVSNQK